VLNVPAKGMESIVLGIGGCSGRNSKQDKLVDLQVGTCHLGHQDGDSDEPQMAIAECVAHIKCTIDSKLEHGGHHHLYIACMDEAYVQNGYWNGKHFAPTTPDSPPFLTFLGSQTFAYVTR
jgi:flavin reductase (DIM6/NTAB) family NADH-FMN oxidoreductase RutF